MQTHAIHLASAAALVAVTKVDGSSPTGVSEADRELTTRMRTMRRCLMPCIGRLAGLATWHNVDEVLPVGPRRGPGFMRPLCFFSGLVGERLGVSGGVPIRRQTMCSGLGSRIRSGSGARCSDWRSIDDRIYNAFRRWRSPEWAQSLFRQASMETDGSVRLGRTATFWRIALSRIRLLRDLGIPAKRRGDSWPVVRIARAICSSHGSSRSGIAPSADGVQAGFRRRESTCCSGAFRTVSRRRGLGDRLTIVGDGPLRSRFEALGVSLGVSECVHFMGPCSLRFGCGVLLVRGCFRSDQPRRLCTRRRALADVETMGPRALRSECGWAPRSGRRGCGGVSERDRARGQWLVVLRPGEMPKGPLAGLRRVFADSGIAQQAD